MTTEIAPGTGNGRPVVLQTTAEAEGDGSLSFTTPLSSSGITEDAHVARAPDISGSAGFDCAGGIDGGGVTVLVLEVEAAATRDPYPSLLRAGYAGDAVEITIVAHTGGAASRGTCTTDDQSAFDAALDGLAGTRTRLPEVGRHGILGLFPSRRAANAAGDRTAAAAPPARRLPRAGEAKRLVPFRGDAGDAGDATARARPVLCNRAGRRVAAGL